MLDLGSQAAYRYNGQDEMTTSFFANCIIEEISVNKHLCKRTLAVLTMLKPQFDPFALPCRDIATVDHA
jgi:hypothetical protein